MKGLRKGFQGGEMEGIERTKKKEEERRGNKAEALLNRNCDQSIHRSSNGLKNKKKLSHWMLKRSQVIFDNKKISYELVLSCFFINFQSL